MYNQNYNTFWQRMHKSAKEKNFPLRVMFELTYRCNFYCRHCYVPQGYRKKRELKTKEVFLILDQLADMGCFYLGFTGGEPFMRKDVLDIFRYARKKGFEIIIYTNGSLINKKTADALRDIRPNKIDITMPAISKGVFEKIVQAKDSHRRVFEAIELLHKNRINLGFKSCVLKENESEIKDIQYFASSLGASHRLDDTLSPCLDGSKKPYEYRGRGELGGVHASRCTLHASRFTPHATRHTPHADCEPNDAGLKQVINSHSLSVKNLFKCGAGFSQAAITPSGELKMCVMIDCFKYNILKSSFKDSWHRLKEAADSIKPDKRYKCIKCELRLYCKWCPGQGWLYDKNFLSCDPESYNRAKSLKESYERNAI